MRNMGVWGYGVFNLAHILGISTLFGSILVLDLRLLGLWRRVGLRGIATPVVQLAFTGFSVAALSGICMLSVNALDYLDNRETDSEISRMSTGHRPALFHSFRPPQKPARPHADRCPATSPHSRHPRRDLARRRRRDVIGVLACGGQRWAHDRLLVTYLSDARARIVRD